MHRVPPLIVRVHPNLDVRGGGIVSSLMATTAALTDVADVAILTSDPTPTHHTAFTDAGATVLASDRGLDQLGEPPSLVIIEGAWSRAAPRIARWCRAHQVPYVYVPHGSLSDRVRRQFPRSHVKKLAYWLAIEHWVAAHAETIWFASEEEQRQSARTFPGMPVESAVIPFTTRELAASERLVRDGSPLQLVTAARVVPVKDLDVLIRAMAAPGVSWHLHIAGDEDHSHAEYLRALATELDVADRITWHGFLSMGALERLYAHSHAYVCPGLESFGMSVAEALSANLPVVASDAVALSPFLGPAGEVFPRRDVGALVSAVSTLEQRLREGGVGPAPRAVWEEQLSPARFRDEFSRKILERLG